MHCKKLLKTGNNDVFEEKGDESDPDSWEHKGAQRGKGTTEQSSKENKNRTIHEREASVPHTREQRQKA